MASAHATHRPAGPDPSGPGTAGIHNVGMDNLQPARTVFPTEDYARTVQQMLASSPEA